MTCTCKSYIIKGEESTDNVLKLIGEQIDNFKTQGFAFLSIDTFEKTEAIEKDRYVPYETYKEVITKIIKDTEVTDFNVSLKTNKGDVLYMFDFGFTKFVGLFFDLDECHIFLLAHFAEDMSLDLYQLQQLNFHNPLL